MLPQVLVVVERDNASHDAAAYHYLPQLSHQVDEIDYGASAFGAQSAPPSLCPHEHGVERVAQRDEIEHPLDVPYELGNAGWVFAQKLLLSLQSHAGVLQWSASVIKDKADHN